MNNSVAVILSALLCLGGASSRWYTVTASGLNLRSRPSLSARVVVVVPRGARLQVSERKGAPFHAAGKKGRWAKVTWQGKRGWVFDGFLRPAAGKAPATADWRKRLPATIICRDTGSHLEGCVARDRIITLRGGKAGYYEKCMVPVGNTVVRQQGSYQFFEGNSLLITLNEGTSVARSYAEKEYVNRGKAKQRILRLTWIPRLQGFVEQERLSLIDDAGYTLDRDAHWFRRRKNPDDVPRCLGYFHFKE